MEVFKLRLGYGTEESEEELSRAISTAEAKEGRKDPELGSRVELEWNSGEEEEPVALRLQSQLMVAAPSPKDTVVLDFSVVGEEGNVGVGMRVVKKRAPLRSAVLWKAAGSGQQTDGVGVLTRLLGSDLASGGPGDGAAPGCSEHWKTVTLVSLCGVGLTVRAFLLQSCPKIESFMF